MSRLEKLLNQPFAEATNRGFHLLLVWGVVLLAGVAALGREPLLVTAVVAYLLALPAYVAHRVRTWNESLAAVETPEGREESSVAGQPDDHDSDDDG